MRVLSIAVVLFSLLAMPPDVFPEAPMSRQRVTFFNKKDYLAYKEANSDYKFNDLRMQATTNNSYFYTAPDRYRKDSPRSLLLESKKHNSCISSETKEMFNYHSPAAHFSAGVQVSLPLDPAIVKTHLEPALVHTLQRGESINTLGEKYRLPGRAIVEANPWILKETLSSGQELIIPPRPKFEVGPMKLLHKKERFMVLWDEKYKWLNHMGCGCFPAPETLNDDREFKIFDCPADLEEFKEIYELIATEPVFYIGIVQVNYWHTFIHDYRQLAGIQRSNRDNRRTLFNPGITNPIVGNPSPEKDFVSDRPVIYWKARLKKSRRSYEAKHPKWIAFCDVNFDGYMDAIVHYGLHMRWKIEPFLPLNEPDGRRVFGLLNAYQRIIYTSYAAGENTVTLYDDAVAFNPFLDEYYQVDR